MIDAPCYHCNSNEHRPYAEENGFKLVKCGGCGLLFVTPRPSQEEIDRAHQMGVHTGAIQFDITGSFSHGKAKRYEPILRDLFGEDLTSRDRRWLDIGCGHGELLMALGVVGGGRIDATGLEPNEKKQASAAKHGLNVTHFDLAEHADGLGHDERYDAVSLLNVYSHLPDPVEFLDLCSRLLKPGGELMLETGDTADLTPEEHPRPLFLPDHLSFASEEIVRGVVEQAGFEVLAVCKYPAYSFGVKRYVKELVKLVAPGKQSQLRDIPSQRRLVAKKKTDMYLRARLR
ncbi:MAG: class I SAM-dependent methyltransferase [Planctomycetota bacterium]